MVPPTYTIRNFHFILTQFPKLLKKQIEEKMQNINTLNNYQEISEYKKNIDTLISKKIGFIGDATENKDIKKLIKQRKELESKLKNSS